MARKKPQPRILRPRYSTGNAERAATANDRYVFDREGRNAQGDVTFVSVPGIRDRKTNSFDARLGMTESAIYDEIARLNAGQYVSPIAQGKGRRPEPIKQGSAQWWVEMLLNIDATRNELFHARDQKRALSTADMRRLMTYSDEETGLDLTQVPFLMLPTAQPLPPAPTLARPLVTAKDELQHRNKLAEHETICKRLEQEREKAERKLIVAVAKQLERVAGIVLTDERNGARGKKREAKARARGTRR